MSHFDDKDDIYDNIDAPQFLDFAQLMQNNGMDDLDPVEYFGSPAATNIVNGIGNVNELGKELDTTNGIGIELSKETELPEANGNYSPDSTSDGSISSLETTTYTHQVKTNGNSIPNTTVYDTEMELCQTYVVENSIAEFKEPMPLPAPAPVVQILEENVVSSMETLGIWREPNNETVMEVTQVIPCTDTSTTMQEPPTAEPTVVHELDQNINNQNVIMVGSDSYVNQNVNHGTDTDDLNHSSSTDHINIDSQATSDIVNGNLLAEDIASTNDIVTGSPKEMESPQTNGNYIPDAGSTNNPLSIGAIVGNKNEEKTPDIVNGNLLTKDIASTNDIVTGSPEEIESPQTNGNYSPDAGSTSNPLSIEAIVGNKNEEKTPDALPKPKTQIKKKPTPTGFPKSIEKPNLESTSAGSAFVAGRKYVGLAKKTDQKPRCTVPHPFKLHESRAKPVQVQEEKFVFKARPAPTKILHGTGPVGLKAKPEVKITQPHTPHFASEDRLRERHEHEKVRKQLEDKRKVELEKKKADQDARRKAEEAELRKTLVHKAQPAPKSRAFELKHTGKPLTEPHSPAFAPLPSVRRGKHN